MSLRPNDVGESITLGGSLDEALEQVILALESDQPLDRENLLERFPQWAAELDQFIDNWVGMEQKTAALAENLPKEFPFSTASLGGRTVGDYELLELISNGGMGVVYRARQISLGRIVALKMVMNAVRDKPRFRMEAEAAASLHHANIVAIHEVGEFEETPFLSMQYIAGGNLQERLQTGPLEPRAAAQLVRTIASAVHYAHQRGILHRDLKPANVLLDDEGVPFVTDFGLAKQLGNSVELTRSGAIIGTPGYMAPEQAMGQVKSLTVQADVYGLGAILYATLTGNAPFKSNSDLLTLRKVIEEPPLSPRAVRRELDRNLETICLKCLEKSPAARYGSARQLADDLNRYLQGEPVSARPIGMLERRWRWCARNPTLALLTLFACLMLTAVVLISLSFAWREYLATLNTKFANIRQAAMAEAVEKARRDAENKSLQAQQAVAALYTTNGLWAARTDLHGEALLWFSRVGQIEGLPLSVLDDNNTRCLSWLAQCPKPIAAMALSTPLHAATFLKDWPNWQLSPTQPELMLKSGTYFGIWNFERNEIWQPTDNDLLISSAGWSGDGEWLALGDSSGEIRLIDALTKATRVSSFLPDAITSLAFSTAGNKLAVSTLGSLTIFDTQLLIPEAQWEMKAGCLNVRFSNDDTQLLASTSDGKAIVYDLTATPPQQSWQISSYLPPENTFTSHCAPEFSQDGTKVFVRTEEQRVRVYDSSSGSPLGGPIVTGRTFCVALAHDQAHCAAGGDSYARLQSIQWDRDVPTFVRHSSRLSHDDAVTSLVFGGTKTIATAGRDRIVHLWRVGEAKLAGRLYNERDTPLATLAHTDDVVGLLFNREGSQLVTVQHDGLIRVWQIPSFDPPGYVTQLTKGGSTVKVVAADEWLISGATHWRSNVVNASLRRFKDGVVIAETPIKGLRERGHLLDAALSKSQEHWITLHANPARSGETMMTTGETAGSIQVWQFPGSSPIGPPIPVKAEPRSVEIHPSQSMAAVLLVNMEIMLVDLAKPAIVATLSPQRNESALDSLTGIKPSHLHNGQLQFSRDGRWLFAWGVGKGFYVWNWLERQPNFSTTFADQWNVRSLALSPDGAQCAVAREETNQIVLIDCDTGKKFREFEFTSKIRSVEFSPTGERLLVACQDNRARLLDVQQIDRKAVELEHAAELVDACFSPDGLSIASLTSDMQLTLWRIRDRQWSMKPMRVSKGTEAIVFSPDSQHILTMTVSGGTEAVDELTVLDLSPYPSATEVDLNYASRIGELLSSKSIGDGGFVKLTSAEWLEHWRLFRLAFNKR